MRRYVFVLAVACLLFVSPAAQEKIPAAWERQAQDGHDHPRHWGIPHVYGKTDADAVFGVIYAQAEDDFNRVETNYLNSHGPAGRGGRRDRQIYRDLRMKLFIDPAD